MGGDAFSASSGQSVRYGVTRSLEGTAGVALGYKGPRVSPYIEAAVIGGLGGRTAVSVDGTRIVADPSGIRVRAGLGAAFDVTERLSLSVEAGYERGAAYRDVNGNVGVNFLW
jgi:outer membrane autotransporter protein